jgi:hypothetical protein
MQTMLWDVAGPEILVVFGVGTFLVAAPFIALAEAVVLRLLKWNTFWRSLLDSLLMNLASTLFGVCILTFGLFTNSVWIGLLVSGVLSVLIEGGVLTLLKRHPARQTWLASLVANLVSYAGLAVLFGLAG